MSLSYWWAMLPNYIENWINKYYKAIMLVSMLLELVMLGWIAWHTG